MNRRQVEYVLGRVRELQKKMPGGCDGSTTVFGTVGMGSTPIPGTEGKKDASECDVVSGVHGDTSPDTVASEQVDREPQE